MNKTNIILDVDTGVDDAIAIALGSRIKNIDIKLITTSDGNTNVENVTTNTLNVLQFIDSKQIKVAKGSNKTLSKNPLVLNVHGGKTGLGDYKFEKLKIKAIKVPAIEAMHNVLNENEQKTTIVVIGSSTNLAMLLKEYPEDAQKIEQIIISGGFIEELKEGQAPYSSYNIAHDPDAVKLVLKSGLKITIVPSNHGHSAYLTYRDIYKTKITNQTGEMLEVIFRSYHDRHIKNGAATHDLCALLAATNPSIFKFRASNSYVEYSKLAKAGILMFDFNSTNPNSVVATEINVKRFKKIYFRLLKKLP